MDNLLSLHGKTALITGASSGIGKHIATRFAQAGAHVIVAARRIERLQELVTLLNNDDLKAEALALDVTDSASVEAAFNALEAQGKIADVIVNNAGISGDFTLLDESTEENLDSVFDVNFKGAWRVTKKAGQVLINANKPGSIINLISIAAHGHAPGISTYAMTKSALLSLTKNSALEFSEHGIRVNGISPGTFQTEMTAAEYDENGNNTLTPLPPLAREGTLDDLTGPFLFLASDASSFVTGTCIPVDGGHLLRSL